MFRFLCYFLFLSTSLLADPIMTFEEIQHFASCENDAGIIFRLIPEGYPKDIPLYLYMTKIDERVVDIAGPFTLNDETYQDGIKVGLQSFARGEPVIYTLESEDLAYISSVKIIPFPIIAKDLEGRTLSLEMASSDAKLFILKLEGFKPNEQVQLISDSMGEKAEKKIQVLTEGTFQVILSPAIKGFRTGDGSYIVSGDSFGKLQVKFLWGSTGKLPYKVTER